MLKVNDSCTDLQYSPEMTEVSRLSSINNRLPQRRSDILASSCISLFPWRVSVRTAVQQANIDILYLLN